MKRIPVALAIVLWTTPALAQWPQFRGPNGSGVGDAVDLPVTFGPSENVLWETTVPAGKSSPIVTGERLFLTAHNGQSLLVLCFDRRTGELLWRREVARARIQGRNALNDPASPTPIRDGETVYAFFPELGLIAYDFAGRERWRSSLGPFESEHGLSVSPVIADRWIVLQVDQVRGSYIVGFDKSDGRVVWKRERVDNAGAYSTPVVYRPASGPPLIVTAGPFELAAYSAESGEKRWWADELGYQPKSLPVLGGNTIYVSAPGVGGTVPSFESVDANGDGRVTADEFPLLENPGTVTLADRDRDGVITQSDWNAMTALVRPSRGGMIAFEADGRGDLTGKNVLWREKRSIPNVPSPLIYRGVLYLARNGGILTTLDPVTGKVLKRGRLQGAIDTYYASPVAADGKVITVSESCMVSVLKAVPSGRSSPSTISTMRAMRRRRSPSARSTCEPRASCTPSLARNRTLSK